MANINTYANDVDIIGADKVLGTDGTTGVTKNYTITGMAGYFRTDVINQNAADADEPDTFKLWSGTLTEYQSLTPQADTMYNVTNDIDTISFTSVTGTPTTLAGYGITDAEALPDFVEGITFSAVGSYTFSSQEDIGSTTMSLVSTTGLAIGDQFVNNGITHTITEVSSNFVRISVGVTSIIPNGTIVQFTRPENSLVITDGDLVLTGGGNTLTLSPDTIFPEAISGTTGTIPIFDSSTDGVGDSAISQTSAVDVREVTWNSMVFSTVGRTAQAFTASTTQGILFFPDGAVPIRLEEDLPLSLQINPLFTSSFIPTGFNISVRGSDFDFDFDALALGGNNASFRAENDSFGFDITINAGTADDEVVSPLLTWLDENVVGTTATFTLTYTIPGAPLINRVAVDMLPVVAQADGVIWQNGNVLNVGAGSGTSIPIFEAQVDTLPDAAFSTPGDLLYQNGVGTVRNISFVVGTLAIDDAVLAQFAVDDPTSVSMDMTLVTGGSLVSGNAEFRTAAGTGGSELFAGGDWVNVLSAIIVDSGTTFPLTDLSIGEHVLFYGDDENFAVFEKTAQGSFNRASLSFVESGGTIPAIFTAYFDTDIVDVQTAASIVGEIPAKWVSDVSSINNDNGATNEPIMIKIWTGTLVEYTALTPSSDTLYNITDD